MKLSELIAQLSAEYLANGEAEVRMGNQGFPGSYATTALSGQHGGICLRYSRDKPKHEGRLVLKETTFYDPEPYTAETLKKLMKQMGTTHVVGANRWAVHPHLKTE